MVVSFFIQDFSSIVEALLKPKTDRLLSVFLSPFFPAFTNVIGPSVSVISLTHKIPRARLLQLRCKHLCKGNCVLKLCGFERPKIHTTRSRADVWSVTSVCTSLLQAQAQTITWKVCKCWLTQGHNTRPCILHNALSSPHFLFGAKKFSNGKFHIV